MDVLGPYVTTKQGNKYIMIAEDLFTKWVEAKPCQKADGITLVRFIEEEIVARYGCPQTIISDNGSCYMSNRYKNFCETNHIKTFFSAVEHQQANPVERKNQEVKKMLRAALEQKPERTWDKHVHQVMFTLRRRQNAATRESPSKALLGYEISIPGSWEIPTYVEEREVTNRIPRATIEQRQRNYQQKYAPQSHPPKIKLYRGDLVMARRLKHDSKNRTHFGPQWTGPHVITKKISDEVFEIDRNGKLTHLHIDDLRPAPSGNQLDEASTGLESSDEEASSEEEDSEPEDKPSEPTLAETRDIP